MGITLSMTGAFRETGASFFFIPKGALTHHLQSRRWYSSLRSGRALFTKHPQDASPEGQTMPQRFPAVIVCAAGRRLSPCLPLRCKPLSSFRTTCTRLQKPATGSFFAGMDGCCPAPSIFFCRAKRNKTAPCRGQKGRE
jgi:hypothetical protein